MKPLKQSWFIVFLVSVSSQTDVCRFFVKKIKSLNLQQTLRIHSNISFKINHFA